MASKKLLFESLELAAPGVKTALKVRARFGGVYAGGAPGQIMLSQVCVYIRFAAVQKRRQF